MGSVVALNADATKVTSRVVLAFFVAIDMGLDQYFALSWLNAFLVGAGLPAMASAGGDARLKGLITGKERGR